MPKGAEQPDPWGPTPSHRTNGPGPASRLGWVRVTTCPGEGSTQPKQPGGPGPPTGSRTPIHYLDPLAGREQTPRLRGSGAATCPQAQVHARLPSFLGKTCPPSAFNAGDDKCALPQQRPRRLLPGCTVGRALPRCTVQPLAPNTPRASVCYAS